MNQDNEVLRAHSDPVDWLRLEYARRRAKNAQYSLRAFARHLQVSSGPLSEILSKKRSLSVKMAMHITERLMFSPAERDHFIALISKPLPIPSAYKQLEADKFCVIADWYHYALLSLLETESCKTDPKWMAARLGVSVTEIHAALDRLERLGMIERIGERDGQAIKPTTGWTTTHDIPCSAKRKFHRQAIQNTLDALDEVALDIRDVTSITMAIDVERIPQAKALIKKFRRQLADLLETGRRTEVYQLNVQLIPVSRGDNANG